MQYIADCKNLSLNYINISYVDIFATSSPVYLLALIILGTFNNVSGLLVILLLLPPGPMGDGLNGKFHPVVDSAILIASSHASLACFMNSASCHRKNRSA